MNKTVLRRVALVLSILYGATLAVLALTDTGSIGVAAIIGSVLVGIVWMATGWAPDAPAKVDQPKP